MKHKKLVEEIQQLFLSSTKPLYSKPEHVC